MAFFGTSELKSQLEQLEKEQTSLQTENDSLKSQLSTARAELEQAKAQFAALTSERDELKSRVQAAEARALTAEKEKSEALASVAEGGELREKIASEIRQKELATLAATQGIPNSNVPPVPGSQKPEQSNGRADSDDGQADWSALTPQQLIAMHRARIAQSAPSDN
jgi:septal ring factor EnvC (AmiA/AmiB activator)